MTLPTDPDHDDGAAPEIGGTLEYNARGLPSRVSMTLDEGSRAIVDELVYTLDGLVEEVHYGDDLEGDGMTSRTPTVSFTTRTTTVDAPCACCSLPCSSPRAPDRDGRGLGTAVEVFRPGVQLVLARWYARRVPPPPRRDLRQCSLPLLRQVDGPARRTVRRGEHPRDGVARLDLLDDEELDALRTAHPDASAAAMDLALALEERVEIELARARIDTSQLESLQARPILAVFVCRACGAYAVGPTTREWAVDRRMREDGLSERDIVCRAEAVAKPSARS